ncbi:COG1361 S-layer family protein [Lutispora thermophila]|uniref:Uncharacterized conserved protein n=1 Tax=Lutispora thermophila DSM 19022 TaxID=1122184 RepID=A0A1M6CE99_9FIRM|nr:hypothetical protein [Lutispora thermophila]SHI59171.1 Uncharacterized conserved protein [Lutispora thermophila DSM 19022]
MRKGLAVIMILALMMQIVSLGIVFGDEEDSLSMSWDGVIRDKNSKSISTIYENDHFSIDIQLKVKGNVDTDSLYISFENSSSYKLTSSKPGEERLYKAKKDKNTLDLIYLGGGETNLSLTAYDNNGNYAYLNIELPVSDSSSTPSSTSRNIPKLVIAGGTSIPIINAGEEATIRIPLENISSTAAKNIQATLELDSVDSPFEIEKLSLTYHIDRINGKKTDDAIFVVKVADNASEKIYPLKLKLVYYPLSGKDPETDEYTINVRVQNAKKPPKLVLSAVGYGDEPLIAGEQRKLTVVLRNNGTLEAKDIKVKLQGLKTDGFTLHNSPDIKQIQDLEGNKVIQLEYVLIPSINMATGNHELQLKVDYKDNKKTDYSEEFTFFLPVKGMDTAVSDIKIENIQAPQEEIKAEENFKISFDVVNYNDIEADGVRVSLVTDKEIISKSLNIQSLGKLANNERKRVEFELYATSEAVTKNYPIQINVEFESGVGEKKSKNTISQYVGVFVDRGNTKGTPRIIVDRYNVEPSIIKAGDIFQLTMSLLNTSSYATVSNIKVSLVSDDGVFSPVNSSNTIYIDSIGPKESIQNVFTLTPKRDAEHKTYGISVNIDYEDEKGNQLSSKDMISVSVVQQVKLVLGDVSMPFEVYVGQTFPVSIEFYNMGKTTLYNLMIKTEGNFTTQNSNYYVGNFESGKTEYYDVGITANEPGPINGRIVFTYENAVGEVFEEVKEFQTNVIEIPMEPMPDIGMEEMPEENKIINIAKSPYFIGGSILLAVGIFFVGRKIYKKKKGMTFDE